MLLDSNPAFTAADIATQIGISQRAVEKQMKKLKDLEIKNRDYFRADYLNPAISNGYIELTIPDKPNSQNQKYRLTKRGIELRNQLRNEC